MSPPLRLPIQAKLILSPFSGALLAVVLVSSLTFVAHVALTRDRLVAVTASALQQDQFDLIHSRSDLFTECSMFIMEYLRPQDPVLNTINTYFALDYRYHPCDNMNHIIAGGPPADADASNTFGSYVSYPFGPRHLLGLALSVMGVPTARLLYLLLSYGSITSMLLAAWRHPHQAAIVFSPIPLSLAFASATDVYGANLAHAPGYFAAFFGIAILIFFRRPFQRLEYRLFLAGFLSVTLTFFDLLHGSLPVTLALVILCNHIFYGAKNDWRQLIAEGVMLAGVFVASYCGYTILRLLALKYVYGIGWEPYLVGIGIRLSHEVGPNVVRLTDIADVLWQARGNLTFGSDRMASAFLCSAGGAWGLALLLLPLVRRDAALLRTFAVMLACSCGVVLWYRLFPNHTYVHPQFMVRILAVPAGIGFSAALMVVQAAVQSFSTRFHYTLRGRSLT
jgi:hypothetical protein